MSVASQSIRPGPAPSDVDFDLPALGSALWRRRYRILLPTILVALVTFAIVSVIPPKYQSEARVLVVGRDNVFLRPDVDKDIGDRGVVDQEAMTSQAQIILSREVADEVIAKLKLGQLREFDPTIGGVSPIKKLLGFIGLVRNPMSLTAQERVLDAYYARLNAYPVERSRVIVIDFLSENPELAARVANTIADAYLQRQQIAKQEQARSAGQWLAGEIATMRKKVAAAEAKVEAFRANSNLLVGPNGTTLSAQQLGDLNAQLAAARTQKADAQAKADLIREMLKSGVEIDSSDILNSELIRRLSEQRVTLRAQLAEQSASLLGNHPRIKELKAQIADLDKQIRHEAEMVARSFESDARLAEARVEAQLATFDQFKSIAANSNEQDVQLRALERDAKSQRDLLESYLAKYSEASARDSLAAAPPDARIISRAVVSNVPAYPKKLPTVLIATLAAFLLVSGLVLTRELLAGPSGTAEAEAEAEAAAVARENAQPSPAPARRRLFGRAPAAAAPVQLATETPAGSVDEAAGEPLAEPPAQAPAESAATNAGPAPEPLVAAPAVDRRDDPVIVAPAPPPVGVPVDAIATFAHHLHREGIDGNQIAVFSTLSRLPTSPLAIKFARALAEEARVVLVGLGSGDAAIREISADPNAPGLAELGAGTTSFAEIITRDKHSSLNLIVAGRGGGDQRALLAAPGMSKNFAALAESYGHVVIDVGLLEGPEARPIAQLAPHAILLVERLTSEATADAREYLLGAGFDEVTIVFAGRPERAPREKTAAAA
jgi:polysaccharide biosynthesis transport protein